MMNQQRYSGSTLGLTTRILNSGAAIIVPSMGSSMMDVVVVFPRERNTRSPGFTKWCCTDVFHRNGGQMGRMAQPVAFGEVAHLNHGNVSALFRLYAEAERQAHLDLSDFFEQCGHVPDNRRLVPRSQEILQKRHY